jgi:hypothetical protein
MSGPGTSGPVLPSRRTGVRHRRVMTASWAGSGFVAVRSPPRARAPVDCRAKALPGSCTSSRNPVNALPQISSPLHGRVSAVRPDPRPLHGGGPDARNRARPSHRGAGRLPHPAGLLPGGGSGCRIVHAPAKPCPRLPEISPRLHGRGKALQEKARALHGVARRARIVPAAWHGGGSACRVRRALSLTGESARVTVPDPPDLYPRLPRNSSLPHGNDRALQYDRAPPRADAGAARMLRVPCVAAGSGRHTPRALPLPARAGRMPVQEPEKRAPRLPQNSTPLHDDDKALHSERGATRPDAGRARDIAPHAHRHPGRSPARATCHG